MKILLVSVGTRGDMEPFLAIGNVLKKRNHRVICAFPGQFRELAARSGLDFVSLGTDFIEMLESDSGKKAFGGQGSGIRKFISYLKLAVRSKKVNKELLQKQYELVKKENPERIVYNGKAIYPIIWGMKNPGKSVLISPVPYVNYVRNHTHLAFNSNFGPFLNKLTYALADFGLTTTVMISVKWLGLKQRLYRKQVKKYLSRRKLIYTISPSLFQKPVYWEDNIKVLGFQQVLKRKGESLPGYLKNFLSRHNRVLFITFGSMTNPDPEGKARIFIEILEKHNIPAIINIASGGLIQPVDYKNPHIRFIPGIPYDDILHEIYGVVHHGGSGTTHLALKYGCASLVIPHILDQFVWDKIIAEKGAGPRGISINRINSRKLEKKIFDLWNNPEYKKNAETIGNNLSKEDFKEDLYNAIAK